MARQLHPLAFVRLYCLSVKVRFVIIVIIVSCVCINILYTI